MGAMGPPLLPHLLQSVLSIFTLHPCPIPDCEYPNDINRVVITLTPVTAEALLRGTVLTTLRLPKALTPTPINTYEYWQRPAISIITFQVCVSAPKLMQLITLGNGGDMPRPPRVSVPSSSTFSFLEDMQANPVSSFLH